MRKLTFFFALILGACAHRQPVPIEFQPAAGPLLEAPEEPGEEPKPAPFLTMGKSSTDTFFACSKLKTGSRSRENCLTEALNVSQSSVNLQYPNADERRVRNLFIVSRAKRTSEVYFSLAGATDPQFKNLTDTQKARGIVELNKPEFDCVRALTQAILYEMIARESEVENLNEAEQARRLADLQREQIERSNKSSGFWKAVGVLGAAMQMRNLERRQDNLEIKQQNRGRSIQIPYK